MLPQHPTPLRLAWVPPGWRCPAVLCLAFRLRRASVLRSRPAPDLHQTWTGPQRTSLSTPIRSSPSSKTSSAPKNKNAPKPTPRPSTTPRAASHHRYRIALHRIKFNLTQFSSTQRSSTPTAPTHATHTSSYNNKTARGSYCHLRGYFYRFLLSQPFRPACITSLQSQSR